MRAGVEVSIPLSEDDIHWLVDPQPHEQWFVMSAFRRDALDWVFRQAYPERYVVLEKPAGLAELRDYKRVILSDVFFSRHVLRTLPRHQGVEAVV